MATDAELSKIGFYFEEYAGNVIRTSRELTKDYLANCSRQFFFCLILTFSQKIFAFLGTFAHLSIISDVEHPRTEAHTVQ